MAAGTLYTGLVSQWKFNESSGDAADSVGVNTLTNNNTCTYGSAKVANGVDMEASSSQYLSIADASQTGLDITGSIAVSFWFKAESLHSGADTENIVNKTTGAAGGCGYQFYIYDNGASSRIGIVLSTDGTATTEKFITTSAWSTGTWYHVAVSHNASTGVTTYYRNGSNLGTTTGGASSIFNNSTIFSLGRFSGGTSYFDGMLDAVFIWNRVLIDAEVTSLYASGNGMELMPRITPTDTSGVPVEPIVTDLNASGEVHLKKTVTFTDTSGAPTESIDPRYGWYSQAKSASPTWTAQPKS